MSVTDKSDVYYDPYDAEIDRDPYPLWRRMRDDAPLYYNEPYDFYALSRFADVEPCLVDWETYSSGRGSILELIKAEFDIPRGAILFEDPPRHDVHRGVMSRVFTPRKMAAIEPKVREFCARTLDPLVGGGGFDFVADLGAQMPMRTIGFLLGIPEQDQEAIRDRLDEGLNLGDGDEGTFDASGFDGSEMFGEYIDWRAKHPSDDLMSEMLAAEFEDEFGVTRHFSREELVTFVNLLAGAGNETTTRLIGWTGKLLSEHPGQRREILEDRSLIAPAIEEILRYEAPSPVQARYVTRDVEHHGRSVPEGSAMLLLNASANRDDRQFPDGDRLVITAPDAPIDCVITLTPMNIVQAAADLVWSPVLRKFPDLKIALSEGGIGWIPYFLERIDYNYRRHHAWTGQDFGDKLPSEVFNDRILTCFIDDRFGMASQDFLNLDHVMWECDYPHSDSTWPFAPEELVGHFEGVSDTVIDQVTHLNAMEQFSYDPFTALGGRESATVGALRARAAGHDVSIRSVAPDKVGAHAAKATDLYVPET